MVLVAVRLIVLAVSSAVRWFADSTTRSFRRSLPACRSDENRGVSDRSLGLLDGFASSRFVLVLSGKNRNLAPTPKYRCVGRRRRFATPLRRTTYINKPSWMGITRSRSRATDVRRVSERGTITLFFYLVLVRFGGVLALRLMSSCALPLFWCFLPCRSESSYPWSLTLISLFPF